MKKVLSALLTVCMIISFAFVGFAAFAENEPADMGTRIGESNVFWKIEIEQDQETLEVLKTILKFDGEGVIPDYTNADEKAEYPWQSLSYDSIEFGEKITAIGNGAFAYSAVLKEAVIPETITSIGESVFGSCPNLERVEINANIKLFGNRLFTGCGKLKTAVLPASLEIIPLRTFYNCSSLDTIAIPENVVSIGEYAFNGCISLKSMTIPDSVGKIGKYAFYSCEKLEELNIGNGVEIIDINAFDSCKALKSVTIPDSTVTISNSAFSRCDSLSSVTLPDGVQTIDEKAFGICPKLTSITIGSGTKTIGNMSFGYGKRSEKIEGFTIYGYDNSAAQKYADENEFVFISLNHGSCGENAVWSFDLEKGILSITGSGAMQNYTAEALPEYSRFKGKIKEIVIGDEVTSIGNYAFYNLSVNEMIVPKTVEGIGENAIGNFVNGVIADGFIFCGYIGSTAQKYAVENEIGFKFLDPTTGKCGESVEWSFDVETGTLTLTGTGATDNYTIDSLPEYNIFDVKNVVVGEGITSIGDFALVFDKDIEAVTFPQTITALGENTPFGFKRVQGETPDLEKSAELKVSGYDETPVKAYAEINELAYTSLNIEPADFPELVIGEALKAAVDKENKLIFLYRQNTEKTVFEEGFNKADYTETVISTDTVTTGTTLTLKANEETQTFVFIVLGDITKDANVNSADALGMLQHSVGSQLLEGDALTAGDINNDSQINSADALLALQISVGQVELTSFMPKAE